MKKLLDMTVREALVNLVRLIGIFGFIYVMSTIVTIIEDMPL